MKLFQSLLLAVCMGMAAGAIQAQTGVPVGPSKLAVIDSRAFDDPKNGINRIIKAYDVLSTEFKPKSDELTAMGAKYNQLKTELDTLTKSTAKVDEKTVFAKHDQIEKLERDIKFKQQDAKAAYARREQALIEPVSTDVFAALEAYARQRKIDLLIDLSKFDGSIVVTNSAVDITQAFIKDYNSRNP